MVVIFGWGSGEARDLGEVAPIACPNCHNQVFLHQIHSEKRVSLYFVPVMPYGSNEYLACPICRAGLEIGPQHRAVVDQMRIGTRIFHQGGMAADQYQGQVDSFWLTMGLAPAATLAVPETPTSPASASDGSPDAIADRLEDLARLHASGVLTDAEFTAAKRRLLEK
ncbi:MAG: SHOCT domain-containing protein [Chloroflexota bacterium]